MFVWGLASLSFVYAKTYGALIALRYDDHSFLCLARPLTCMPSIILGIGEAGYYAGMIYYLSFWYQR